MRILSTVLSVALVATIAWAGEQAETNDSIVTRMHCPLGNIAYEWNFADSDCGFTTALCDDAGIPVWEYGQPEGLPCSLWGTGLDTNYPNDAGESLVSPSFIVNETAYLVEIRHWYAIENSDDGGNVSVNGVIVEPLAGYPDNEISHSASLYAWCVDGEPGFTGFDGEVYSCFDLSGFMGEEVQISLNFGSDSNLTCDGWKIGSIRVGGFVVPNDGTTWSAVKGLYR